MSRPNETNDVCRIAIPKNRVTEFKQRITPFSLDPNAISIIESGTIVTFTFYDILIDTEIGRQLIQLQEELFFGKKSDSK